MYSCESHPQALCPTLHSTFLACELHVLISPKDGSEKLMHAVDVCVAGGSVDVKTIRGLRSLKVPAGTPQMLSCSVQWHAAL